MGDDVRAMLYRCSWAACACLLVAGCSSDLAYIAPFPQTPSYDPLIVKIPSKVSAYTAAASRPVSPAAQQDGPNLLANTERLTGPRRPSPSEEAPGGEIRLASLVTIGPPVGAVPAAEAARDEQEDGPVIVDFPMVLGLAAKNNPAIQLAAERIQEAYALELAADSLWLPTFRAGLSYNKHTGPLQETIGRVIDVNRTSLQTGMGVFAVGAGTPVLPGLSTQFHLKNALFEPKIAREISSAREHAANTAMNDTLLAVSLAYLELLSAHQEKAIAVQIAERAKELSDITAAFARSGQGPQADADRTRTELAIRENAVLQADERIRVASARLAELLRLPPDAQLLPREMTIVPVHLVATGTDLRDLVATGLATRPELAENRHLVTAAVERLRQERTSPLIPSLLLNVSYGGFGGGRGDVINGFNDRFDLDAVAFWEVRNLGFGESAARRAAQARLNQAQIQQIQWMDRIARQVVEMHASLVAREHQITIAEGGVKSATDSMTRNLQRIKGGQGLPIEALQSLQALDQAQREFLRTLVDYNEAQFRLHWALGWPANTSTTPEGSTCLDQL